MVMQVHFFVLSVVAAAVLFSSVGVVLADDHPSGSCNWCREAARTAQRDFEMKQPGERAEVNALRNTLNAMCAADGGNAQMGVFNLCNHVTTLVASVADWAQTCTLMPGTGCDLPGSGAGPLAVKLEPLYVQCKPAACVASAADTAVECSCAGECTPQCRASFLQTVEVCRECTEEWASAQGREKVPPHEHTQVGA